MHFLNKRVDLPALNQIINSECMNILIKSLIRIKDFVRIPMHSELRILLRAGKSSFFVKEKDCIKDSILILPAILIELWCAPVLFSRKMNIDEQ